MIRGIRGAITVEENESQLILEATSKLLVDMIKKNNINPERVAQVIMTVTDDLDATFPAKALRAIEGWTFVPVMCMREIPVPNSLEKCVRVMMTVETDVSQEKIQHVYLEGAISLRPDLASK